MRLHLLRQFLHRGRGSVRVGDLPENPGIPEGPARDHAVFTARFRQKRPVERRRKCAAVRHDGNGEILPDRPDDSMKHRSRIEHFHHTPVQRESRRAGIFQAFGETDGRLRVVFVQNAHFCRDRNARVFRQHGKRPDRLLRPERGKRRAFPLFRDFRCGAAEIEVQNGKIKRIDDRESLFQRVMVGPDKLYAEEILGRIAADQCHRLGVSEYKGACVDHFREGIPAAMASCREAHRQIGMSGKRGENGRSGRINSVQLHESRVGKRRRLPWKNREKRRSSFRDQREKNFAASFSVLISGAPSAAHHSST